MAMVKKLAEQPRIEPTIEEGRAKTQGPEQRQASGPLAAPELEKLKAAEEIPAEIKKITQDPRQQQILDQIRKEAGEYSPEMITRLEKLYEGRLQFSPKAGFRREPAADLKAGDFVTFTDESGKLQEGKVRDYDRNKKEAWIFPVDRTLIKDQNFAAVEVPVNRIRTPGPMRFEPEKSFRREPEVDISPGEITGRADIMRFLQEKLGTPIRTGRFREGAGALGVYKSYQDVIRTKNFADIEVIAHEVGHAMHKFLWPGTWAGMGEDAPLLAYKQELADLATGVNVRAGQSPLGEGFAEFMRLYMTNEPMASGLAPNFYKYFDELPRSGALNRGKSFSRSGAITIAT